MTESVVAMRNLISMYFLVHAVVTTDKTRNFAKEFVSHAIKSTPARFLAVQFVFRNDSNQKTIPMIMDLLISSRADLFDRMQLVADILVYEKLYSPFAGLKFLLQIATTDYIFSRTAVGLLHAPLKKFEYNDHVISWVLKYFCALFIFIGASASRNKYVKKRYLVSNALRTIYSFQISSMRGMMMNFFATLINENHHPPFDGMSGRASHQPLLDDIDTSLRRNFNLKLLLDNFLEPEEDIHTGPQRKKTSNEVANPKIQPKQQIVKKVNLSPHRPTQVPKKAIPGKKPDANAFLRKKAFI